nr:uncharacterized protein LOC109149216 [Ipomoea batatas]
MTMLNRGGELSEKLLPVVGMAANYEHWFSFGIIVEVPYRGPPMNVYRDRVVIGSRVIPGSIPTFTGWTTRAMKDREFKEIRDGGFGLGTVDTPLREPTIVKEPDGVGLSSKFCAGQCYSLPLSVGNGEGAD